MFHCLLMIVSSLIRAQCAFGALLPLQVATSTKQYGPDGPWQAVQIALGTPPQPLDLYPGGTFESIILTTGICSGINEDDCGQGGLFAPDESRSIDNHSIRWDSHDYGTTVDWTMGAMNYSGQAEYVMDELHLAAIGTQGSQDVPQMSIRMVTEVSMAYPDGSTYPLQVGQLALGSSNQNQTFKIEGGIPSINASLVPSYLWQNNIIPSASYGLHIGSASLDLPLSLWLGGYDQTRVLGEVSSLPSHNNNDLDNFIIDLFDISIVIDHGGSPFDYRTKAGLLAMGNSTMPKSLAIAINPAAPYLNLPASACAAIAKELPVTYNVKYGLYFWNVQDSRCTEVVTSPSYLGFSFRAPSLSAGNLTIKVPFQLLNLTLDAPLIDNPTQYLPCQPPQLSSSYSLGRAFLQAAFIGVDWNGGLGNWYLAQAPGPNTASIPSQKRFETALTASRNNWADTWIGIWTPLPESNSSAGSTSQSAAGTVSNPAPSESAASLTKKSSVRPSVGALAGIGVGCAAVAVLAIFIAFIWWRRRNRRSSTVPSAQHPKNDAGDYEISEQGRIHEIAGHEPRELHAEGVPIAEFPEYHAVWELGDNERATTTRQPR